MVIKLAIALACLNVLGIVLVLLSWHKDCKRYGKDNLAVSLKDRIGAFMFCITIPCVLGLLSRWEA